MKSSADTIKYTAVIAIAILAAFAIRIKMPVEVEESGRVNAVTSDGIAVAADIELEYIEIKRLNLFRYAARGSGDKKKSTGISQLAEDTLKEAVSGAELEEVFGGGQASARGRFVEALEDAVSPGRIIGEPAVNFLLPEGAAEEYVSARAAPTGRKFIVLGFDGIDRDVIDRLLAAGRLPNIRRMINEGVYGPLRSIQPSLSPLVWTTIATGMLPEKHGIMDYVAYSESGATFPVNSTCRRVPALWQMAGWGGIETGVVGWMASWPAEPVNGFMVTDRILYDDAKLENTNVANSRRRTWPPALAGRLRPLIEQSRAELQREKDSFFGGPPPAGHAKSLDTFINALANFYANRRIALHMLEQEAPALLAVYFAATDTGSHEFMEYAAPRRAGVDAAGVNAYGETVFRTYELMDETIGEFIDAAGGDYNIIIVSDHGFKSGDLRPWGSGSLDGQTAMLWHRQTGVVMARGPDIPPGREIAGASVADVTPTLLYALGLPQADDMDGRVLTELFTDELKRNRRAPLRVSGYGWLWRRGAGGKARPGIGEEDERELARLRQLGYLGGFDDTGDDTGRPGAAPKPGGPAAQAAGINQDGGAARRLSITMARRLNNSGIRSLHNGDYAAAADSFAESRRLVPESTIAWQNHANALLLLGRRGEAGHEYLELLSREPYRASHHVNYGILLALRGDTAGAAERFQRAARLAPDTVEAPICQGVIARRDSRINDAIENFERATALDNGSIIARLHLATAYYSSGRYGDAAREFEAIFTLRRGYLAAPGLTLAAGIGHLCGGDPESARRRLEQARAAGEDAAEAYLPLVDRLSRAGAVSENSDDSSPCIAGEDIPHPPRLDMQSVFESANSLGDINIQGFPVIITNSGYTRRSD